MKRIALVISHEGSGSSGLCELLNRNQRVQWCRTNLVYEHMTSLEALLSVEHKLNNHAAVWLDQILHNYLFRHRPLLRFCRYIYIVREPKPTLSQIVTSKIDALGMGRYYCYRLRRICEMARKTPGALLLTWDDMVTGRAFGLLEDYLCLKEHLELDDTLFTKPKPNPFVSTAILDSCQKAYERYLYYLRNLPLLKFEFSNAEESVS